MTASRNSTETRARACWTIFANSFCAADSCGEGPRDVSRSTGLSSSADSQPSSNEDVARWLRVRRKLSTSRLRVMVVIQTCRLPRPLSKLARLEYTLDRKSVVEGKRGD